MQCEAHWHANGGFSGETNTKKLSYLHSSGSQFIVWMLNSMVLLALVTSVQWTPPDLPPVKHCQEAVRNKDQFFFNSFEVQHLKKKKDKRKCHYPYEPGVHGAEHGAVRHHGLVDLVHVVHQPAEFHGAEVRADRESGFMLQHDTPPLHMLKKTRINPHDGSLAFRWFLFLPGVLLMRDSTVDWVRRSSQTRG